MIGAPGSFGWLVQHDLRLGWRRFRAMFRRLPGWGIFALLAGAVMVFHAIGWPAALWLARLEADPLGQGSFYAALASGTIFVLPWLISQGMNGATRALYSRGDLDLLLASPLSPGKLLAARMLALAIESVMSVSIFLLPLANDAMLQGKWGWAAIYPVIFAGGFLGTAIGLLLTMGLFLLIGPRRTRMVAQVIATLIGACFVLTLQVLNVVPRSVRLDLIASLNAGVTGDIFDYESIWWTPVRAATGQPFDLVVWVVLCFGVFAAVTLAFGRSFAAGAAVAGGQAATPQASRRQIARPVRFRGGVGRVLRRKEWSLLIRDPWLLSQILLQVIYTLPVSIVIWRSQGPDGSVALSVAPAIVVVASQLSASLAWLTVSSEDAPEFLASAPVARAQVERRKLEAIALPLAIFLAVPVAGLVWFSPASALWTFVFGCLAALSTALLNLWHPSPGKRGDVMRRHSQSKFVGMIEHLMSLAWAVAMVLAVLGSLYALIPIGFVAILLWANSPARPRLPKSPPLVGASQAAASGSP